MMTPIPFPSTLALCLYMHPPILNKAGKLFQDSWLLQYAQFEVIHVFMLYCCITS